MWNVRQQVLFSVNIMIAVIESDSHTHTHPHTLAHSLTCTRTRVLTCRVIGKTRPWLTLFAGLGLIKFILSLFWIGVYPPFYVNSNNRKINRRHHSAPRMKTDLKHERAYFPMKHLQAVQTCVVTLACRLHTCCHLMLLQLCMRIYHPGLKRAEVSPLPVRPVGP